MPRSELSRTLSLGLRAGDWVVVRSRAEILATLDARGCMDGLPFQPEMFAFCGRRMQVAKVAHKTCDTTTHRTGGRRMYDAVHLQEARCDGALHDGCQADCVFFWKEAWLRRPDGRASAVSQKAASCTEDSVMRARHAEGCNPADPTWVCQTTAIYEATDFLPWWDVRQYVRDVASRNHTAWHMLKLLTRAGYRKLVGLGVGYGVLVRAFNAFQRLIGGDPYPAIHGKIADGSPTPTEILDLQPGEWVRVKPREEIAATITRSGVNRGMRYDVEMLKYSDRKYRVQMRVDRLINEKTGKMVTMKAPAIQLENVYCRAECTPMRLGCPRASNTYWREIWLRRCDPPAGAGATTDPQCNQSPLQSSGRSPPTHSG
jgi:hypothetical protein